MTLNPNPMPKRVFISYSHDSPAHRDKVLELSEQLRADGIDARIDQYVEHEGQNWPDWCEEHIRDAELVLMVCTSAYRAVVEGKALPGSRKGICWEADQIKQEIYDANSRKDKFIPILLGGALEDDIPARLRGVSYFSPEGHDGYEKLFRRITGQPRVRMRDLGLLRRLASLKADVLPPLPDEDAEQQAAAYLERLRQEVGQIKIGSIDRNTTQAVSFAIGDVYIPLHIRAEGGRQRIESALKHRKLIVQGDAGSGKSTFLKCVAFDLSLPQSGGTPLELEDRGFPLYIRVPELDAHLTKTWNRDSSETKDSPTRETDPRWISHFLAMLDWGAPRSFFESKLRRENTVLLLDGLDEAPGENSRERMAKLLDGIAQQYPKCRIVVATRPHALTGEARPAGFEEIWIDEFDNDGVQLFVQRWCACRYPGEPEQGRARTLSPERSSPDGRNPATGEEPSDAGGIDGDPV